MKPDRDHSIQMNFLIQDFWQGRFKGKSHLSSLYRRVALGKSQCICIWFTQEIIPGHKGRLPKASWHTIDKYKFSFINNTCESFHHRHFQFCLLASYSFFSECLLSPKAWQWPEARCCVFYAIISNLHAHSGCQPKYMCLWGPLAFVTHAEGL
jgi:hypothetical protein